MQNWKEFSENTKIWIYQSSRQLSGHETEFVLSGAENFCSKWASHGSGLTATIELFYNRFLILFADEDETVASGCSIDKSVHFIQALGKHLKVDFFDRTQLAFLSDNKVMTIDIKDFPELYTVGQINADTIIFNNSITTKKAFLNEWKIPLKQSWLMPLVTG